MKTKKNVYVIEVRHSTGSCVYEIAWSDLVQIAMEKCIEMNDELSNDESKLVESYLRQNNNFFCMYENALDFVERIALWVKHNGHKAQELERSFKRCFKNDQSMLDWFETFLLNEETK